MLALLFFVLALAPTTLALLVGGAVLLVERLLRRRVRRPVDADERAAEIIRTALARRGYTSREMSVVPAVGLPGEGARWHLVLKGRHERVITVASLGVLHGLVLTQLMGAP